MHSPKAGPTLCVMRISTVRNFARVVNAGFLPAKRDALERVEFKVRWEACLNWRLSFQPLRAWKVKSSVLALSLPTLVLKSVIDRPQKLFNVEDMANVVWYSVEVNTWPGTSGMSLIFLCLISSAPYTTPPTQETHRWTPLHLPLWKTILASR